MLNEIEFSTEFAKRLTNKVKGLKILSIDGLEIQTKFENASECKYYLNNCYAEYLKEPESIEEVLENYLSSSDSLDKPNEKINISDIFPVIKDERFIQSTLEINPNFEKNLTYEQYNSELYIFYVEDTGTNINYLTQEDFTKLNIEKSELKKIAVENLSNSIEIERHGENGCFMVLADGNYESSMILLDIWNEENFKVKGEIIVGIPSRDLLIITGKNDAENIVKLKHAINQINENGDHLVSEKLFEYKNGKFETI